MASEFKSPHLGDEEDKNTLILTAAAKGAGLALVTGGLIAFSGARYSRTYQTLSRPMKTFLLGSGIASFLCFHFFCLRPGGRIYWLTHRPRATGTFSLVGNTTYTLSSHLPPLSLGVAATSILFADHARVQYEDRQLLRHLDQEAADAKRAEIRAQRGVLAELHYQVRENRNMVVGVSWLSCMGGSLLYTFSKKGLTTTQRIVTARKISFVSLSLSLSIVVCSVVLCCAFAVPFFDDATVM